jgi:hypothetical protein
MASVSDTRYKQRAGIEFLVAGKEIVGNIHNGCVLYMEVVHSIGALLDAGFRELRLQEVEKRSCMIDRGLGVLPQPPAQTCCSAPMTLFMRIGTSQVGSWTYSFQYAMEVQWQLLTLWDIQRFLEM